MSLTRDMLTVQGQSIDGRRPRLPYDRGGDPHEAPRAVAPRTPDEVIASANRNEELQRQIEASLEEERRGEKGTPFRQILEEERRRHPA
jgi:hypothetical protein